MVDVNVSSNEPSKISPPAKGLLDLMGDVQSRKPQKQKENEKDYEVEYLDDAKTM